MASDSNSGLLRVLFPAGGEPTLVGHNGKTVTLSSLLDQVTLDQAIELLKVAHMSNLQHGLREISSQLRQLNETTASLRP
ncbi:MAG: hypothetical protein ACRDRP_09585 [Pseudonocardiaceae bacterium]